MTLLNDTRLRGGLYQVIAIASVMAIAWVMYQTAHANLASRNIATGFGFLSQPAGFDISDSPISYSRGDTFGRALVVGLLNTLKASVVAIITGTIIGVVVGVLRFSPNPLLSRILIVYVELLRNVPLLLYLFLWYAIIIFSLPPVSQAIVVFPGVFLSNSGLTLPALGLGDNSWALLAVVLTVSMAAGWLTARLLPRLSKVRMARASPWVGLILFAAVFAVGWKLSGIELVLEPPVKGKFRLSGGYHLRPEFVALTVGLALGLSASVAEIVRAGIQAVEKGQWEAARAVGLRPLAMMRLVILPQALRIAVPPLTSNYLTTVKNSSLAIAIGFPDLVSISNTMMNKTGQAIETIAIFMSVYLGLSVLISIFMNWYNARVALKGLRNRRS